MSRKRCPYFFGSQCKIQGNINTKIYFCHNFWLEGPTDLRSTLLSYIFHALSRDTHLGHVYCAQPNSQIAKYPNIWLKTKQNSNFCFFLAKAISIKWRWSKIVQVVTTKYHHHHHNDIVFYSPTIRTFYEKDITVMNRKTSATISFFPEFKLVSFLFIWTYIVYCILYGRILPAWSLLAPMQPVAVKY